MQWRKKGDLLEGKKGLGSGFKKEVLRRSPKGHVWGEKEEDQEYVKGLDLSN